jgi:hypothetical protein
MSDNRPRELPPTFTQGPVQGRNVIGEITESLHRFILDGWTGNTPPPRIEEDLSFVPKDREEVVYVYMYRTAQNTALMNSKQWRPARINLKLQEELANGRSGPGGKPRRVLNEDIYYERAPLYLNVFYMIAVHSKFRSDAERLVGWLLTRLYDATHLVYRPRKYYLPNGRIVDSTGAEWDRDADGDEVVMEKIGLSLVDDLTLGDAIHFYTIHEAPFRPYLTYRAACAMEGPLLAGPPTTVRHERAKLMAPEDEPGNRRNGRLVGSPELLGNKARMHIGPPGFGHEAIPDEDSPQDANPQAANPDGNDSNSED